MPKQARILKLIRQTHLYVGAFIAPAIVFFAISGALQTFSLHEAAPGSSYRPARWIVVLAQIHKKQTMQVPARKLQLLSAQTSSPEFSEATGSVQRTSHSNTQPLAMKVFFVLVSAGLLTSTSSGLYMSYKYCRNRAAITLLFVAGILVPVFLTVF